MYGSQQTGQYVVEYILSVIGHRLGQIHRVSELKQQ